MKTLTNKYNFPNLPVPDKNETLAKFLTWVEPLVTTTEFKEAQALVTEYLASPLSEQLHQFLVNRATDKNNS